MIVLLHYNSFLQEQSRIRDNKLEEHLRGQWISSDKKYYVKLNKSHNYMYAKIQQDDFKFKNVKKEYYTPEIETYKNRQKILFEVPSDDQSNKSFRMFGIKPTGSDGLSDKYEFTFLYNKDTLFLYAENSKNDRIILNKIENNSNDQSLIDQCSNNYDNYLIRKKEKIEEKKMENEYKINQKAYVYSFPEGTYECGVDFDEGKYDIQWITFSAIGEDEDITENMYIYKNGELLDSTQGAKGKVKCENITFYEGDELKIEGSKEVDLIPKWVNNPTWYRSNEDEYN